MPPLPSLTLAARAGDLAEARRLLEAGASVDAVDPQGRRAIHDAARNGDVAMVALLLDHGADKNGRTPMFDHTPLLDNLFWDPSPAVVHLLVARGASLAGAIASAANIPPWMANDPVRLAARREILDLLVEAELVEQARFDGPMGSTSHLDEPLRILCLHGEVALIKRVHAAGAWGVTPAAVDAALQGGHLDLARWLMVRMDPPSRPSALGRLLHHAVTRQDMELFQWMLSLGGDPRAEGPALLALAAQVGDEIMADWLLAHAVGDDRDALDLALCAAARHVRLPLVEWAARHGGDPARAGGRLIEAAVAGGELAILQWAVTHGAQWQDTAGNIPKLVRKAIGGHASAILRDDAPIILRMLAEAGVFQAMANAPLQATREDQPGSLLVWAVRSKCSLDTLATLLTVTGTDLQQRFRDPRPHSCPDSTTAWPLLAFALDAALPPDGGTAAHLLRMGADPNAKIVDPYLCDTPTPILGVWILRLMHALREAEHVGSEQMMAAKERIAQGDIPDACRPLADRPKLLPLLPWIVSQDLHLDRPGRPFPCNELSLLLGIALLLEGGADPGAALLPQVWEQHQESLAQMEHQRKHYATLDEACWQWMEAADPSLPMPSEELPSMPPLAPDPDPPATILELVRRDGRFPELMAVLATPSRAHIE